MGTVAAYLVGGNNLSGPISDSALLRERLADNVAIAGQNEMNGVAFNQNIMVTVPGNTRFYIVVQQTANSSGQPSAARRVSSVTGFAGDSQAVPNLQELRELLQLRQELSQLYQQEPSEKAVPDDNQPQ
jgi:predicted amino acid dehydrogenase